jgi:phosphoglycolate phosphatase-like HAD superfamily hydrolase
MLPILMQRSRRALTFLFDVDNTLLDNDRVKEELAAGIEDVVGPEGGARFWQIYEDVRRMRDYVDYPHTLQRFREVYPDEPAFPEVAELVLGYPYQSVLYPGALEVLARVQSVGPAAILTDGDPVYQAAKIARAGLADAVERRVFLFAHKEAHLAEVQQAVPADRYVIFDDKLSVLDAVERMDERVFTVHVRQGHYGVAAVANDGYSPGRSLERIGDLLDLDLNAVLGQPD